jgi:hypothetical protein
VEHFKSRCRGDSSVSWQRKEGRVKDTFIVKLSRAEADWIKRQAVVFGSYSAVIRTAVRVVVAMIGSGILIWEFNRLQRILLENDGNTGNASAKSIVRYAWKGIAATESEAIEFMQMVRKTCLKAHPPLVKSNRQSKRALSPRQAVQGA